MEKPHIINSEFLDARGLDACKNKVLATINWFKIVTNIIEKFPELEMIFCLRAAMTNRIDYSDFEGGGASRKCEWLWFIQTCSDFEVF